MTCLPHTSDWELVTFSLMSRRENPGTMRPKNPPKNCFSASYPAVAVGRSCCGSCSFSRCLKLFGLFLVLQVEMHSLWATFPVPVKMGLFFLNLFIVSRIYDNSILRNGLFLYQYKCLGSMRSHRVRCDLTWLTPARCLGGPLHCHMRETARQALVYCKVYCE